jgi:hypothetical protein
MHPLFIVTFIRTAATNQFYNYSGGGGAHVTTILDIHYTRSNSRQKKPTKNLLSG